MANMFKKGTKCGLTTRFSTVGRESGSSDLARDPRGFSVKFRTAEGNWDFVANNTPVFFREYRLSSIHGRTTLMYQSGIQQSSHIVSCPCSQLSSSLIALRRRRMLRKSDTFLSDQS
jgi:hypothetical protein